MYEKRMDKQQKIMVLLLVVAIAFSVISIVATISIMSLSDIDFEPITIIKTRPSDGKLAGDININVEGNAFGEGT